MVASISQPTTLAEPDYSDTTRVTAWILLGVTLSITIIRQIAKVVVFKRLGLDDVFMLMASILATGLAVAVVVLTYNGLGAVATQPKENDIIFMKSYYASQILYIAAVSFAKMSMIGLLYTIFAVHQHTRRMLLSCACFICAWSIASALAIAFQCNLPRPWETSSLRCFNSQSFWISFGAIDVCTEIFIIVMPIYIVSSLRVRTARKVAFATCFLPRILVIAASIAHSFRLYRISGGSNQMYLLWFPCVIMQVHLAASILTAFVLYMLPFFRSLDASLRHTYSSRSDDSRMESIMNHSSRTIWFRRRQKSEAWRSAESTVVDNSCYERLPHKPPYISTPRPLSPITPPQYQIPQRVSHTEKTGAQNYDGLCIQISGRDAQSPRIEISGPQTGSSTALSPSCNSPNALMSNRAYTPTRKVLTLPPKSYSPHPPTVSSCYSSRSPSPPSPAMPRFSLFPQQTTQHRQLSSRDSIELVRSSISNGNTSRHSPIPTQFPSVLSPYHKSETEHQPLRTSASTLPKPLMASRPKLSPPIATLSPTQIRPESIQVMTSPMGAAINNYFQGSRMSVTQNDEPENIEFLPLLPELLDARGSPRISVCELP